MSNEAAKGFAIIAMVDLGYSREQIEKVVQRIDDAMDVVTDDQAESKYFNY